MHVFIVFMQGFRYMVQYKCGMITEVM